MTPAEILATLERNGFTATERDGQLFVSPASKLDAEDRAFLKLHRDALVDHLRQPPPDYWIDETGGAGVILPVTDDYDALAAWFLTARLPSGPYRLDRCTVVSDPSVSHGYLRDRIAEGPRGWQRRAIVAHLRKLRAIVEGET